MLRRKFLQPYSAAVPVVTYSLDYLIVAGGGAHGGDDSFSTYYRGGGGGGGFRNNTLTVDSQGTIDITVGQGGAQDGTSDPAPSGGDSILVYDTTTITIDGGGGAGRIGIGGASGFGADGGSGGGAGGNDGSCTGGSATGGLSQGNDAGDMINGPGSGDAGTGGGGAGGASANVDVGADAAPSPGGLAAANSITGTSVNYAGGGGGGRGFYGGHASATYGSTGAGANSGFGGNKATGEGDGDSGVVILKIPNTYFSDSYTGSPVKDTTSVSGYTILKFTGDGTYTT